MAHSLTVRKPIDQQHVPDPSTRCTYALECASPSLPSERENCTTNMSTRRPRFHARPRPDSHAMITSRADGVSHRAQRPWGKDLVDGGLAAPSITVRPSSRVHSGDAGSRSHHRPTCVVVAEGTRRSTRVLAPRPPLHRAPPSALSPVCLVLPRCCRRTDRFRLDRPRRQHAARAPRARAPSASASAAAAPAGRAPAPRRRRRGRSAVSTSSSSSSTASSRKATSTSYHCATTVRRR